MHATVVPAVPQPRGAAAPEVARRALQARQQAQRRVLFAATAVILLARSPTSLNTLSPSSPHPAPPRAQASTVRRRVRCTRRRSRRRWTSSSAHPSTPRRTPCRCGRVGWSGALWWFGLAPGGGVSVPRAVRHTAGRSIYLCRTHPPRFLCLRPPLLRPPCSFSTRAPSHMHRTTRHAASHPVRAGRVGEHHDGSAVPRGHRRLFAAAG